MNQLDWDNIPLGRWMDYIHKLQDFEGYKYLDQLTASEIFENHRKLANFVVKYWTEVDDLTELTGDEQIGIVIEAYFGELWEQLGRGWEGKAAFEFEGELYTAPDDLELYEQTIKGGTMEFGQFIMSETSIPSLALAYFFLRKDETLEKLSDNEITRRAKAFRELPCSDALPCFFFLRDVLTVCMKRLDRYMKDVVTPIVRQQEQAD